MSKKSIQVDIFVKNDWQAGIMLTQEHLDAAYKLMEILQTDEVENTDHSAGILQEIEELHERVV
jgi:hypothetical protein